MIGVVGATGMVGRTMIDVLTERGVAPADVRLFASDRSAGQRVAYGDDMIAVNALSEDGLAEVDTALFALGDDLAEAWVPCARARGVRVIDNSATFRLDPAVPLVVPEVNHDALDGGPGLVANPNCSTIIMVLALAPLARAAGLRRVTAATYQSASGAGSEARDELRVGIDALSAGRAPTARVFPRPLAGDCLPQVGRLLESGASREEWKMTRETRRILSLPELPVSVTCVRVPVDVGHAVAVHLETIEPLSAVRARTLLEGAPGVTFVDPSAEVPWGTPRESAGRDDVLVSRLRADEAFENGLALWVAGDNLRKGAATNAIQIADVLGAFV